VQLVYGFTARLLVQSVDVLRNHCRELSFPLKLRKRFMRAVRLCVQYEHFLPVKAEKQLRMRHKIGVTEHHFRRNVIALAVESVLTAKIWDTALGRDAGASEKNDTAAFFNQSL